MKQFDAYRLDTANECLWHNGKQLVVPPKPFAILRFLVENPGRLITHDELLDAIWPETYVQPQVLRTYMLELRRLLGDDPAAPRFIQTLPKRGYQFVSSVSEAPENKPALQAGPAPLSDLGGRDLIDREAELTRLMSLLQLVNKEQRQFVLVTGTTGIGKTALVDAFAAHVEKLPGAVVARGQCVEGLRSREEYYPVAEALSRLCAAGGERACRILARMAPHWLPAMDGRPESGLAASRMPGDLCAALEEFATEQPLLLIFEDVHWADASTCSLLSALARRRAPAKLLVLATLRPQERSAEPMLKAMWQDLSLRKLGTEIALRPFGRTQVRALAQRHLGQEVIPPGLDEFVYQHSEGNPLFVTVMLEHLVARGHLARRGDEMTWRQQAALADMETSVPDELARMVELEIERLAAEDQELLEAASLVPVASPAWAIAAALNKTPADIEEACDELARRLYFVRRAGEDELPDGTRSSFYVFAHGLYREVLYQRQASARRARRHIRIAERLRAIFAGKEASVAREISAHYEAAGEWYRAAECLLAAAEHAEGRGVAPEAAALREHALRIAENLNAEQRAQILERTCSECRDA